jgi:hypothetical protein
MTVRGMCIGEAVPKKDELSFRHVGFFLAFIIFGSKQITDLQIGASSFGYTRLNLHGCKDL